ncbi:hypothetical protein [uncultured Paludibaculum sp.]|uniref:hypothetical protein n=1 Tax=uncultured Paludibaculum sp. TaxID=1765020 RepID=UPI002AAB576A|nr:hypothetical protein [uncultured Paludibaculum sp.]
MEEDIVRDTSLSSLLRSAASLLAPAVWCVGGLFLATNPADASTITVTVCNQDFYNCTTNSTGDLISIGSSGSGVSNNHNYSWAYAAAAQVKTDGAMVPGLGVSVSLSEHREGYLTNLLPTTGRRLFAIAGISDGLDLANVATGTITFTFDIEGSADFRLFDSLVGVRFASPQFGNTGVWQASNHPQEDFPLATTVTMTAPFSQHRLNYRLSFEASLYCSYFNGILCTDESSSSGNYGNGSAFADFLNTATVANVQVYDAQGNLVDDPGITSDAGYLYPVNSGDVTATPEPVSFWMVGMGLGIVAVTMRKCIHPTPPQSGTNGSR